MAKASGLGGNFYINGYDLSGDVSMISSARDSQNLLDVTALDKSATERLAGLGDGELAWTSFFNDAALAAHVAQKTLSGDKRVTYAIATTLGAAGYSLVGNQTDYAGTRGADGSLAFNVQVLTNDGEGNRGGVMLTAGKRTDTSATIGTSVDNGAATALGACAYLHVFSFSGTDVTVKLEDSANNSAFADLTGGGFTTINAGNPAPTSQRLQLGAAAAVRQYVRVTTTTSAGFTSLVYAVMLCRR